MFIMPLQKGEQYRAGATYEWKDLSWEPTQSAQNELITRLHNILRVPFEIVEAKAGVRPATVDRRPFVGVHPQIPELAIFNGLGTKGVSLAPYYAQQFTDHLIHSKEMDSEVNIGRFNSLYYLSK
jgi:glycine/D-amino acid oxidase-like deaminating enzyme